MVPEYFGVFRLEFTKAASRWKSLVELFLNLAGYGWAAYLWHTGAPTCQILIVGGGSALLSMGLVYIAGQSAWRIEREARGKAESDLNAVLTSAPRLLLRNPGAVHIHENVAFLATEIASDGSTRQRAALTADFLKVAFINDPEIPAPSAEAKGVVAKVQFLRDGALLREIDGRWSESTQPGERIAKFETTMDLLRMDFGIGEARTLDIAMKERTSNEAYMFNNDSYYNDKLKRPDFRLEPGTYSVRVRLRAPLVDEVFEFTFVNPGANSPIDCPQ